jgi:hypothetical protein
MMACVSLLAAEMTDQELREVQQSLVHHNRYCYRTS